MFDLFQAYPRFPWFNIWNTSLKLNLNEKGRWDHHLPRWGIWHDMTTYILDLKPTWITPKSSPRNIMNLLKGLWIESQQHGAHGVSKFPDGFGSRSPRKKKIVPHIRSNPTISISVPYHMSHPQKIVSWQYWGWFIVGITVNIIFRCFTYTMILQ